MSFYSSLHLSYHTDEMHHKAKSEIPFFGENINALSYLAWEKKIEKLHPFFVNKYHILSLRIYRFVGHASE